MLEKLSPKTDQPSLEQDMTIETRKDGCGHDNSKPWDVPLPAANPSKLHLASIRELKEHYNINADLRWAEQLPPPEARKYLANNIQEFIAEYVGSVATGEIKYGPHFEIGGGKTILESMENTINIARREGNPLLPRLQAELEGLSRAAELLDSREQIFWIVPPGSPNLGFGRYGFLNVIEKQPGQILVHWYRYHPARHDVLPGSRWLFAQLDGSSPNPYLSENSIIRQPLPANKKASFEQIQELLANCGLRLSEAVPYFNTILTQLEPSIKVYAELIILASQSPMAEREQFLIQAEKKLAEIYYQAKIMAAAQKEGVKFTLSTLYASPRFIHWQREALRPLSGSCPSVGIRSILAVAQNPLQRMVSKMPEREGICPICGFPLDRNGYCSKCGWPKTRAS